MDLSVSAFNDVGKKPEDGPKASKGKTTFCHVSEVSNEAV